MCPERTRPEKVDFLLGVPRPDSLYFVKPQRDLETRCEGGKWYRKCSPSFVRPRAGDLFVSGETLD